MEIYAYHEGRTVQVDDSTSHSDTPLTRATKLKKESFLREIGSTLYSSNWGEQALG